MHSANAYRINSLTADCAVDYGIKREYFEELDSRNECRLALLEAGADPTIPSYTVNNFNYSFFDKMLDVGNAVLVGLHMGDNIADLLRGIPSATIASRL